MGQLFTGSVAIRGIRGPIPSGYMLGRVDSGSGPPQLVSMAALGSKMVQSGIPVTRLSALQDVAFSTLSDKNHIQYNLTAGKWVNVAAPALSNLTDVNTTGVVNTSLLRFDSGTSKWIPWSLTYTLVGASDVLVTSPANGDLLTWNTVAGKWINAAPPVFTWSIISSNTTAVAGHGYFCDTSVAAFTLTLPASPAIGDSISVEDVKGTFGANNLTVARNLKNIGGLAQDMTVSTSRAAFGLVYTGDATLGWQVAEIAAGGGSGGGGGGGSSTLAGDTDVVLTSPANNDLLTFDTASGKWINKPAAAAPVSLLDIYGLSLRTAPPAVAGLTTRLNGGSIVDGTNGINVFQTATSINSNALGYVVTPIVRGATNKFQFDILLKRNLVMSQWVQSGIILRDSVAGTSLVVGLLNDACSGFCRNTFTNDTTWASVSALWAMTSGNTTWMPPPVWLRVIDDNTTRTFYMSWNGVDYFQILSEAKTTFASAANQIGFVVNPNGGGGGIGGKSYLFEVLSWKQTSS